MVDDLVRQRRLGLAVDVIITDEQYQNKGEAAFGIQMVWELGTCRVKF